MSVSLGLDAGLGPKGIWHSIEADSASVAPENWLLPLFVYLGIQQPWCYRTMGILVAGRRCMCLPAVLSAMQLPDPVCRRKLGMPRGDGVAGTVVLSTGGSSKTRIHMHPSIHGGTSSHGTRNSLE